MKTDNEIVNKLFENRLLESKVGAFYMIGDKILSNSIQVSQGEQYGDYVNYSSHWDLWRAACKAYPKLTRYEYDDFPRGRVVFDKNERKFIIYIDKKLNRSGVIDKIRREYSLGSNYEVNDTDEHYDSLRGGDNVLSEDIILDKDLSSYVKRETY